MRFDGNRTALAALALATLALAVASTSGRDERSTLGQSAQDGRARDAAYASEPAGPAPLAATPSPNRARAPGIDSRPLERLLERVETLERRLAALEADPHGTTDRPVRLAVSLPESERLPETRSALRELVRGWDDAAREERRAWEEAAERTRREREIEFDARYEALLLARELELPDWRRDEIAQAFMAIEGRRWEIEQSIDPLIDDPLDIEEQWIEFDQWADGYPGQVLGEELWSQIEAFWNEDDWGAEGEPGEEGQE